jgi:glutamate racemase
LAGGTTAEQRRRPIGVFDSGVGGLTVLAELRRVLPHEDFVYLGDTARLPYGTKSPDTVARYAIQSAAALVAENIKLLIVACNTAASVAVGALRERFAPLPVLGVLEPGADAACRASPSGRIAVIATEGTIAGGAYQRALRERRAAAAVVAAPCPLFVPLAEEGWTDGDIVLAVAHRYLDPIFSGPADTRPDTLLLGCTHFPVLAGTLREVVGPGVTIVDSAVTTAAAARELLRTLDLARTDTQSGRVRFLATDGAQRFARVGSLFLDTPLASSDVRIIDL